MIWAFWRTWGMGGLYSKPHLIDLENGVARCGKDVEPEGNGKVIQIREGDLYWDRRCETCKRFWAADNNGTAR